MGYRSYFLNYLFPAVYFRCAAYITAVYHTDIMKLIYIIDLRFNSNNFLNHAWKGTLQSGQQSLQSFWNNILKLNNWLMKIIRDWSFIVIEVYHWSISCIFQNWYRYISLVIHCLYIIHYSFKVIFGPY